MKWRVAVGAILMVASLPCFGFGGFIVVKAMDQNQRAERQTAATDKQCRERLATLGQMKETDSSFEVTVKNVTDPRKSLYDVTLAQALCPQRTLTDVCVGEACEPGSKSVTLKFRMQAGK